MDNQNIKKQAVYSTIWKFMERILAQMVSLVVSIVIARILNPDDYSVVGIVTIFFTFANVLISGGLNTALIQKKDADDKDFSSVLIISVLISAVIYGVLYFCAPWIANAYHKPILVPVTRVMGLALPITAVKGIWCAYISSHLQFKKFFFSTIGGTAISAVVGIVMALQGFGPWALVAQQMSNTVIGTVVLMATTKIRIRFRIYWNKLAGLFRYGWKVFVSSVIGVIYTEINPMIIGLKYSSVDLSYYTKGRSFPNLISSTTTSTLSAVLFPVLSKCQDDREMLLKGTRRFIQLASFVAFPLMLGFYALAENFVIVILTEKWLPAIPYIRIFCLSCMLDMIHIGNCETIKAMGRSDIYLIMEIIKKSCYFIVIGLFVWLGDSPQMLAASFIVCALIATVVNSVPNRKLIGYKLRYQCYDLLVNLATSVVMCIAVSFVGRLPFGAFYLLLLQVLVGVVVYITINAVIRNSSFMYLLNALKKAVNRKAM